MTRHVLIFGCGPMPCEPDGAVMAPGARTWQIVRTCSDALADQDNGRISVLCLESATRPPFVARAGRMGVTVYPLAMADFVACEKSFQHLPQFPAESPDSVVGCASIQPCATAVDTARRLGVPVWADIFGDPLSEVQSAAAPGRNLEPDHESALLHVWRLLTRTLIGADHFSALSGRQRLALVGQLGCCGRLNAATACHEMVTEIPYGLWLDELSPAMPMPTDSTFRILWSGSFNTWTDPETLSEGMALALREEPRLQFEILGGGIAGYHEGGYARFRAGLETHQAPMDRIALLDWQPYRALPQAYARCHGALSLDRWTYEATLGSRTRVVHMLAAGRPVISTAISELTELMAREGTLIAVETGQARSLADGILKLARLDRAQLDLLGLSCRKTMEKYCSAASLAEPLQNWIRQPFRSPDQLSPSPTNALLPYWQEAVTLS